ncbi:MAG: DUF2207 domain-containing protein [Coriobacteriales bacterium]|nr:DUF2207 domain-containing protein [Coriobacteriales bacterium]
MTRATRSLTFGALVAAVFLASFILVPAPQAYAKDYSSGPVRIDAEVSSDGSMRVVEQRSFDFDGSFSTVWWNLPTAKQGGNVGITVDSVALRYDSRGGDFSALSLVPFKTAWRTSGGPGLDSYSVDNQSGTVDPYVFFTVTDETITVKLTYTVSGALNTYLDVAELYWKFVGPGWQVDSHDVTTTITLPVPTGTTPVEGDIRAWGHGDLTGSVSLLATGASFKLNRVAAGSFAEARVVFPVGWASDVAVQNNTNGLAGIIAEETAWAEEANAKREQARLFVGLALGVCFLLVAGAFVLWWFKGREYKPAFAEKYWRDYPSDDHPAVLGALWNWGKVGTAEISATLLKLTNEGVVSLDRTVSQGAFGREKVDYLLSLNTEKCAQVTNTIDREALDLFFGTIGSGAQQVAFSQIAAYGKTSPESLLAVTNGWKSLVAEQAQSKGYFEVTGNVLRVVLIVVAVLLIGLGGIGLGFAGEIILAVVPFVCAVLIFIIASGMRRRSKEAVELYARCRALRNWLADFSNLAEAIPTDVKVWNHFLVFAVVFGVADKVIKQLQIKLPQIFEDAQFMPTYWWFASLHSGGVSPIDVLGRSYNTALNHATSADSSGGGFGGGFSGGGGGGFGGGGGGAR